MSGLADDTKTRLLNAAGAIFAEKGYAAATIREICRRAGANVASVNYYFGGKVQLYVESVRHAHGSARAFPAATWGADASPADKLRSFVEQMLRSLLDRDRPAWQLQLLTREMLEPSDACRQLVESTLRPRMQLLQEIVDDLLPAEVAEAERHLTAFSILGQCLFFNRGNPIAGLLVGHEEYTIYDAERLADHVTRFSLAALNRTSVFVG